MWMYSGNPFIDTLCCLACLVLGIGIVLLLIWAAKTWNPADLKKWGWILVAVGLVLCIFTIAYGSSMGWQGKQQYMGIEKDPME
jgi:hypothetical protein